MNPVLTLHRIGPIKRAQIAFGDLTVLVGPQASGKSILLQWLKLILDTGQVQDQVSRYGMDWGRDESRFLDLYFGEGMHGIWRSGESSVRWNRQTWDLTKHIARRARKKDEAVVLIPAQRVLTLRDGWPLPFGAYSAGDPFSVRWFSEKLRLQMEREFRATDAIFPKTNRLKREYREMLEAAVFGRFQLSVDTVKSQKRLVLSKPNSRSRERLPFMVWSAGQREFVPLLLGLYSLMPPAQASRRGAVEWVIIEEPEMGMHPRAVTTVLLLVLELLYRGYRVCIATHSPQVLDLVWALQSLARAGAAPRRVLELFLAPQTPALIRVASRALKKSFKVYFFQDGRCVHDITQLNPLATSEEESSWGGMLDFTERVNEAVAAANSNGKGDQSP